MKDAVATWAGIGTRFQLFPPRCPYALAADREQMVWLAPQSVGYKRCGDRASSRNRMADMPKTVKSGEGNFDTVSENQSPTAGPNDRQDPAPHERDESAHHTGRHEKPARTGASIDQAGKDVERGLIDTERRGVPNDVPGANPKHD